MHYKEALENCIFRFVSGSQAYGTQLSDGTSDFDYRGVFIAPLKYAFQLFQTSIVERGGYAKNIRDAMEMIDSLDFKGAQHALERALSLEQGDLNLSVGTVSNPECDEELQELRKFLKLAAENNPNIIEFCYIDKLITHKTKEWDLIVKNRDMFLSKKARWTFSGYAIAQMKRIEVHRGYLLNPPSHKPLRSEYGLPEKTTIPTEYHNAILSIKDDFVKEEIKDIVRKEKSFRAKLEDWNAYERWKKERNPKRRELEAKWGYDSKHASHLVRLSRMAKEILIEKTVHVFRPDHEELLAIRNGAWTFEKLLEHTKNFDKELDELYKKSDLRDRPDHQGIADLYKEICESRYGIKI